jgi:hypothetical protein
MKIFWLFVLMKAGVLLLSFVCLTIKRNYNENAIYYAMLWKKWQPHNFFLSMGHVFFFFFIYISVLFYTKVFLIKPTFIGQESRCFPRSKNL